MKKLLVISPHPDDEVLGAGGTLFKRKSSKKSNSLYWIIVTKLQANTPRIKVLRRKNEIKKISKLFGFKKVFQLDFNTTELDSSSKKRLIKDFSDIFKKIKPYELFVPHFSDVHSDHKIVSEVISTCTKNFRFPFIKKILAYEVLSETDYNLNRKKIFFPNYYEDISKFITKKKNAKNNLYPYKLIIDFDLKPLLDGEWYWAFFLEKFSRINNPSININK